MWVLPLLGYLGVGIGFCFLTLAIASGLYYLSELVEEHSVFTKRLLSQLIFVVIGILVILCLVDGFPFTLSALSIGSHGLYYQNLRRFPIVKLGDPIFIVSCVLVLLNHYLWFRHFSAPRKSSAAFRTYEEWDEQYASFTEVASFFGLCVWLIPFALFVSLSASENVLPSMGSDYATGEGSSFVRPGKEPGSNGVIGGGSRGGAGLAKQMVDGVRGWAGEVGEMFGMSDRQKSGHNF